MRFLMRHLALASALVLVCSCDRLEPPKPISALPAADLQVEPEPRLTVAQAQSEAGYEAYNQAVLDWGRRGWLQVARACRWTAVHVPGINCPPTDPEIPPR